MRRAPPQMHALRPPPSCAFTDVRHRCSRRKRMVTRAAAAVPHAELLVVGPGVLGSAAGSLWLSGGGSKVVAQTNSTTKHADLRRLGLEPRTRAEADPRRRFTHVLFSAPPSGSTDYAAEVTAAAQLWDADAGGAFVFTSSTAVYADTDDAVLTTEQSPTLALGTNPRADVLLRAEAAVLAANGCVLRLAGLYTLRRGAHTYYLTQAQVPARPDGVLNLLHYNDAAAAAVAALTARRRAQVFLACDGAPITRAAMMTATLASGLFPADSRAPEFTATVGPLGKRLNCDQTQQILGWTPSKASFQTFLTGGGLD